MVNANVPKFAEVCLKLPSKKKRLIHKKSPETQCGIELQTILIVTPQGFLYILIIN